MKESEKTPAPFRSCAERKKLIAFSKLNGIATTLCTFREVGTAC